MTSAIEDELVGAVAHDIDNDPFPVKGIDHVRFVVGNAKQAAHYYSTAFGMTLIAYRGPETGHRDCSDYVLKSGSSRFVFTGSVRAGTPEAEHHARHGDGVVDIALAVPYADTLYRHRVDGGC